MTADKEGLLLRIMKNKNNNDSNSNNGRIFNRVENLNNGRIILFSDITGAILPNGAFTMPTDGSLFSFTLVTKEDDFSMETNNSGNNSDYYFPRNFNRKLL
jgi:hypothetical protein